MLSVRLLSFAYSVTAGRWTSWQDGLDHMKDGGILEALPLVAVVQSWIFAGALLCVTIPPAGRLSRLTLFALCVAAAAAASCVHVFSTAAFQWLGICKDGNAGQAQWANWARTWLCFAYGTVLPLAATVSLVGKLLELAPSEDIELALTSSGLRTTWPAFLAFDEKSLHLYVKIYGRAPPLPAHRVHPGNHW
ncbi:hypothetical protein JCM10213_005556 [Rhodosporidiobolus nylandii]